jgi:hypothetical protein
MLKVWLAPFIRTLLDFVFQTVLTYQRQFQQFFIDAQLTSSGFPVPVGNQCLFLHSNFGQQHFKFGILQIEAGVDYAKPLLVDRAVTQYI